MEKEQEILYSRVSDDCKYHGKQMCTCAFGEEGHVMGRVIINKYK